MSAQLRVQQQRKRWKLFRSRYFPLFLAIFVILSFLIPLILYNSRKSYIVFGGILSIVMIILVLISYIRNIFFRRHPSKILIWRTLCNLLYSIVIVSEAFGDRSSLFTDDSSSKGFCSESSALLQFTIFSGECWLLMLSIDLYYGLTDPFMNYEKYLRAYHCIVWTLSGVIALSLYFNDSCQGHAFDRICWIHLDSNFSYSDIACFFGYFLVWVVSFYILSIGINVFAYTRLSQGLTVMYEARKASVINTFQIITVYSVYGTTVLLVIIVIFSRRNYHVAGNNLDSSNALANFVVYMLASRGTVDAIVWFLLYDQGEGGKSELVRFLSACKRGLCICSKCPWSMCKKDVADIHRLTSERGPRHSNLLESLTSQEGVSSRVSPSLSGTYPSNFSRKSLKKLSRNSLLSAGVGVLCGWTEGDGATGATATDGLVNGGANSSIGSILALGGAGSEDEDEEEWDWCNYNTNPVLTQY